MRIAAERLQCLEVMEHGGIISRHRHRRHGAFRRQLLEALGPCAGLVVHVPVERFGEGEALRGLQAQRMDVVDKQQQRRELLATRHDAEFGRLLDRIGGVAAGIGEPDHFCLRRLRLQQEG